MSNLVPCINCKIDPCEGNECIVAEAQNFNEHDSRPDEEANVAKKSIQLDPIIKNVLKRHSIATPITPLGSIILLRKKNFLEITVTDKEPITVKYSGKFKGEMKICYRNGVLAKIVRK